MSLIKSKYLRRERSVQGENLFDDINTNSKNTLINLSLKQHRAKKNSMSFADSVLNTKKFGLSTNTSQNSSVHLEDFLNQKKHKKFITSFSNSLYNESIAQTTPSSEIEIRDITNKIPRGNKGTYINKNLSSKMKKILIETGDENLFNKKGGRKSMKVKEKIDKLTQGFIKERAMMVNRPVSDFKNEKDYGSYYQKISPLERRVNTLINCPSKSNKYKAELAFRNLNKRYVQKAKINLDGDEKRKEKEDLERFSMSFDIYSNNNSFGAKYLLQKYDKKGKPFDFQNYKKSLETLDIKPIKHSRSTNFFGTLNQLSEI